MKDPLDIPSSLNQFVIRLMKPFLSGNFVIFLSPKWRIKETTAPSVFAQRAKNLFRDNRGFTFLSYIYGINISKVPLPVASDTRYRIECVNDISRAHTCACKWRAVVRDVQSPNPPFAATSHAGIATLLIHIFRSFVAALFVRCEARWEAAIRITRLRTNLCA